MTERHYHAVIWIDHREARVFHFSPTDVETLSCTRIIRPDISITRQTLSGAGMQRRAPIICMRSLNRLQMPVQS